MNPTTDLTYSAHSIQDFVDCPRRFELKYLLRQPWPAVLSEPVLEIERKSQMGIRFHQIVQQIVSGIRVEDILQSVEDRQLSLWIKNFVSFFDQVQPHARFPELAVMMSINDQRIIAIMDLVLITEDNMAIIFDWKTTERQPKLSAYQNRVQSRIYPMALVASSHQVFPGLNLKPEDVELVYWFPQFPEMAVRLDYSQAEHLANKDMVAGLIRDIERRQPGEFELTRDKSRCKFCAYRSLCERGITAGNESEAISDPSDISLDRIDFDQVEEIPF